jgi:hypothetical protein
MTRRRRRLLLIALLVLVGIPVLAAIGVGSYLRSGGLEREIEHGWTAYGLPGRLEIGSLRLIGVDEAEAKDIVVRQDGQPALATARKMRLRFDLVDRRLLSLRIDGVEAGLDAQRYRFLLDLIQAERQHPPTRAPSPVRVEVVNGTLILPGGLVLGDAAVQVEALGSKVTVEGVGSLAGRPVRVAVSTARSSAEAPIITSIEVREGSVSPRAALTAMVGIGLISQVPDAVNPWLPELVDCTGSRIELDVVSDTFRGTGTARWAGGEGSCEIDADARRVVLRRLSVRDDKLGGATGELTADRAGTRVAIDAGQWSVGPGLPLPAGLPMADVARLLPSVQLRWPTADGRTAISLVGPGRARLEVTLAAGTPPRLAASELPLVLMQSLLPAPLVLGGGHVVQASAVFAEDRPEFSATLSQARLLAEGWSIGPLDGQVAAVLVPGGTVQVTANLLSGEQQVGRLSFAGNASTAHVTLACAAVESLLARLRGPAQLPDLTGSVAITADVAITPAGMQVDLRNLDLSKAELRLRNHDFIRGLTAKLLGRMRIAAGKIEISLDGQLLSGEFRIPGEWLSLAARTPRFTLDASARLEQGQLAELVLGRAMVRAADVAGEAVAGGFSAQLDGRITGETFAGTLQGLVDHADLAWLTSLVVPGQVQVGGEGAVVFQAHLDGGEVRRIDGSFLPLGADLDIDRGKLKVGGITGGVRFTIGGEKKP